MDDAVLELERIVEALRERVATWAEKGADDDEFEAGLAYAAEQILEILDGDTVVGDVIDYEEEDANLVDYLD